MPTTLKFVNKCLLVTFLAASFLVPALAQTPAAAPKPSAVMAPQIEGKTIDGGAFNLSMLKGKVVLDYERNISRTVPVKQRFVQLWTDESGYKDNLGRHSMLPAAYLIDKSGKVVERHVGRIAPEA